MAIVAAISRRRYAIRTRAPRAFVAFGAFGCPREYLQPHGPLGRIPVCIRPRVTTVRSYEGKPYGNVIGCVPMPAVSKTGQLP